MSDQPMFDPADADALALLDEPTLSTNALYVNVDFIELVEHYGGDEAKAYETLGKLRDLLT